MTNEAAQILTTKELAGFLKTSTGHMARLRRAGGGPPYYCIGKAVRYVLDDVKGQEPDSVSDHVLRE